MKTNTERRALGRGLGALLPGAARPDRATEYLDCPLDRIRLPGDQPRRRFDESRLRELADSVRTRGVLQPVVVSREGDGYQLIAGERRVRAARMAGLRSVPAVVRELSPDDIFEVALIENIQREDLDPIEEAMAYARLIDSHGYSQEELAQRVGKDRSTITNALRLLQLDPESQALIADGQMSPGHARALLAVTEDEHRVQLQQAIVSQGLSVREAERRAREARTVSAAPPRPRRQRPLSQLHEIVATELAAALEARVRLLPTSRRAGRIVIDYDSLDALRRIHALVTGQPTGDIGGEG
jgi:ParB family chromosome partitioning protein